MNSILKEDFNIIENNYSNLLSFFKNKTILVTGSCGMITTYQNLFLLSLAEKYDFRMILQCRKKNKAFRIFHDYIDNPRLIISDFNFEKGEFPEIVPDIIIHAASSASTQFFLKSPVEVMSPNIVGTWNLLNYAKSNQIAKFVFFSSNSIYGEGGNSKLILSEDDYGIVDPLNDRSCYVESKRASEQMCRAFAKEYNVPTSIIRICHTYGPTFDIDNDTRIIPRTLKKICRNEDIEIFRDSNSVIQYTYIADILSAILTVIVKGGSGEAYNSGSDEIVKMDDVIEWMISADNRIRSKLIIKDIDSSYPFAKGKGINFVKLSNDKLKNLGWRPLFSIREGFSRMVQYYL